MQTYTVITPSAYLPVSVADMKVYLKVQASYVGDDDQIEAFIVAAKEYIERYTKRFMGRVKVEELFDAWPADLVLTLQTGLITAVCELAYWDGEAWVIVDESDYYTSLAPVTRTKLTTSQSGLADVPGAIRARYWAGMDDGSDIPTPLLTCIKMAVAFWTENTSDQDITDLNYLHAILKQYVINR